MPETTYMVVDPRRDHSMRIPRPDLSVRLGTPNACNRCHTSETAEWAAAAAKQWYGSEKTATLHYGQILSAGRAGAPGAESALATLPERERHIFVERRLADEPKTLAELGQVYGISRERVRQLEVRAYEKVKRAVEAEVRANP